MRENIGDDGDGDDVEKMYESERALKRGHLKRVARLNRGRHYLQR